MEGTIFSVLPDEVIVQILLRVPTRSFGAVSRTCKYWQSILLRREFWKFLAQLLWGEQSIPSADVTNAPTETLPVIKGTNFIDWKAYFKIRSEIDGIARLMNLLKYFARIDLNVNLDSKISAIASNIEKTLPPFENEGQASILFSLLASCCQSSFAYRKGAVAWLDRLPMTYFLGFAKPSNLPFLQFVVKMTQDAIATHREEEAQLLLEFWSSTCDEEMNYRDEGDESSVVIANVVDQLVPTLIGAISDDKYAEGNDDDWNVRKAAETCLALVSSVVGSEIGPLVDPILRDLCAQDGKRHDVALTILAAIITDEANSYVQDNLPTFTSHVLALLRSNNATVRANAAWALSRICNGTYASNLGASQISAVAQAIIASLRDEERVRRFMYMCIVNAESENLFEEDFTSLVQALLESLAVVQEHDRVPIFEAIASLVNSHENVEAVKPLLPLVLHTLQHNFNDGLILATAITRKLQQELAPHIDAFMSLYLPQLQVNPSDELLLAIGNLVQVPGAVFSKYLPSVMPLIIPLLADVQQTAVFASAVTTLVDMCQGATEAISPYCPSIVTAVLLALQSPNVDPKAKSDILALMGDIAIAIGGVAFEAYLPRVLQALSQAGEAILLADIYYEDNAALQQAWFSTWSSLFQSFHHKPEMLMDAIPQVRNVIVKATRTLIDKHSACYAINLLGDILQCSATTKPLIFTVELQNCLANAENCSDPSIKQAAKWVAQLATQIKP